MGMAKRTETTADSRVRSVFPARFLEPEGISSIKYIRTSYLARCIPLRRPDPEGIRAAIVCCEVSAIGCWVRTRRRSDGESVRETMLDDSLWDPPPLSPNPHRLIRECARLCLRNRKPQATGWMSHDEPWILPVST